MAGIDAPPTGPQRPAAFPETMNATGSRVYPARLRCRACHKPHPVSGPAQRSERGRNHRTGAILRPACTIRGRETHDPGLGQRRDRAGRRILRRASVSPPVPACRRLETCRISTDIRLKSRPRHGPSSRSQRANSGAKTAGTSPPPPAGLQPSPPLRPVRPSVLSGLRRFHRLIAGVPGPSSAGFRIRDPRSTTPAGLPRPKAPIRTLHVWADASRCGRSTLRCATHR